MKFITNNSSYCIIHISYKEMYLEEAINTKLLGLQIDNHLSWKSCTEQMIPKLSRPCYAIASMIHNSNINTLKPIYYTYFQSIIKYRIIFWGNSSNSGKIFTLQKIIRIMAGAQHRTSRRSLQGDADKSLAWPGRNQATVTELEVYSTYSPWSSIHFLARCSNFCKSLKKNSEGWLSNQVSAAAMTSVSDEKWRPFNRFFSPGNRW